MSETKRLVLDILKPHKPSLLEFTKKLSELDSVDSVNGILYELDEKVANIKITMVGEKLDFKKIKEQIQRLGGSVHSIDEAVCGKRIVDEVKTPQG